MQKTKRQLVKASVGLIVPLANSFDNERPIENCNHCAEK